MECGKEVGHRGWCEMEGGRRGGRYFSTMKCCLVEGMGKNTKICKMHQDVRTDVLVHDFRAEVHQDVRTDVLVPDFRAEVHQDVRTDVLVSLQIFVFFPIPSTRQHFIV